MGYTYISYNITTLQYHRAMKYSNVTFFSQSSIFSTKSELLNDKRSGSYYPTKVLIFRNLITQKPLLELPPQLEPLPVG